MSVCNEGNENMRNIIVTTPKTEIENAKKEAEHCLSNGGGYYFRKVHKIPKDIVIGESKVYYVEDGFIRGFALVIGCDEKSEKCEVTNKEYNGGIIYMTASSWKWIKPIKMKGFQGWRYFDDNNVEIVGDWKDPKPSI